MEEGDSLIFSKIHKRAKWMIRLMALNLILFFVWVYLAENPQNPKLVSNEIVSNDLKLDIGSIDPESNLIVDEGYILVKQNCQSCHHLDLVTQNFFTKEVWLEKIRWMQAEQNLWDLGDNELPILNYLAKYYNPSKKTGLNVNSSRRPNLDTEWYLLD